MVLCWNGVFKIKTKLLKVHAQVPDIQKISQCAQIIQSGGLVAFPTETVYGLGANAMDQEAVAGIFRAKGRPADNPLIVHIGRAAEVKYLSAYLPAGAADLIKKFWPGPLTIVLPRHPRVPKIVSAGLDTVAVRMPQHPVALALIKTARVPIAAPSANRSGKPSPTTGNHVLKDLGGKIDAVLDAGRCDVGVESTVIDLTTDIPTVLRPGGVTLEQLREVLGEVEVDAAARTGEAPRAPGMKYAHYAPEGELVLVEGDAQRVFEHIKELYRQNNEQGYKTAVLAAEESLFRYRQELQPDILISLGARSTPEIAANKLYGALRSCDTKGAEVILCEAFPREGVGMALMNRLEKAARRRISF